MKGTNFVEGGRILSISTSHTGPPPKLKRVVVTSHNDDSWGKAVAVISYCSRGIEMRVAMEQGNLRDFFE